MYVLIVYITFMSAAVAGLFGRFLGRKGAVLYTISSIGIAFLLSCMAFVEVGLGGSKSEIILGQWVGSGSFVTNWGFLFDTVTVVMLIVVTSISFLVHIYSYNYMGSDPHLVRFMSYLSLFTFFMLMLVTANNYLQMFLGWEGVGLASYLLINFWYTRVQANKAAIKAMVMNRFGDFGLGVALVLIYLVFKTLDYSVVFSLVQYLDYYDFEVLGYEVNAVSLISLFLFIGAVGKSAQLGLHTWLPDAMEGPTPVSALIHAATMVTAGVFVIIRSSPILEHSPDALIIVSVFGALTAFFAGTIGVFQNDLKRVIAYSTCSQLGYMVFSCGLSNYSLGLFHLTNHAFFKALLFLSAGSIIHALMDEQDMRRMGGLVKLMPYTFVMVMVGSLALMGFPFTTGFYSKDVILEIAYVNYYVEGMFSYWLGLAGAFCTAFYSFRLIYLTFLAETNSSRYVMKQVHDAPFVLGLPLFILSLFSIFFGYCFKDMFIGLGTDFWINSVYNSRNDNGILILESEFIPVTIKNIPVILSLIGGVLALVLYHYFPGLFYLVEKPIFFKRIYEFFSKKWYFDIVYNNYLALGFLKLSYNVFFKGIDRGLIEIIGPTGLVRNYISSSQSVAKLQTGALYNYVYFMILNLIIFLSISLGYFVFLKLELIFILIGVVVCIFIVLEKKNKYNKK